MGNMRCVSEQVERNGKSWECSCLSRPEVMTGTSKNHIISHQKAMSCKVLASILLYCRYLWMTYSVYRIPRSPITAARQRPPRAIIDNAGPRSFV